MKKLTKMSDVLAKTKLKPVTNTTQWANKDGTRVCALSALVVEKGYKVTQRRNLPSPNITKNGINYGRFVAKIVVAEYKIDKKDIAVIDNIIADFHELSFTEIAEKLKLKGF